MKKTQAFSFTRMPALVVGSLACLVIVGWLTHNAFLVQIAPSFAPMQCNTAVGFLLCSLSLAALNTDYKKTGIVTGALAGVLALLTLSQYALEADYGIDTFVVEPFIRANTYSPGRMGLNTAIAMLLSGCVLVLCHGTDPTDDRRKILLALLSNLVFALGAVSLLGYMGGVQTAHGWGKLTHMAIHTAMCFCIVGLSVVAYLWQTSKEKSPWFPVTIGAGVMAISVSLSLAVHSQENGSFDAEMRLKADQFAKTAQGRLTDLYKALDRMGARWEVAGGTPKHEWQSDAHAYIQAFPYLTAIEWLDPKQTVQWVEPLPGNAQLIGKKPNSQGIRAEAIRTAMSMHKPVATDAMTLLQGDQGFLYYVPLTLQNGPAHHFGGLLVGVVNLKRFFSAVTENEKTIFVTLRNDEGQLLYSNTPADENRDETWRRTVALPNSTVIWTLAVTPTSELQAEKNSSIPWLVLAGGTLCSMLVGLSIFLALKWQSNMVALRLEEERRKKLLDKLTHSNTNLERFAYVASHDMQEPLRMIANFSGIIADEYADKLDDTGKEYLKFVKDGSLRMQDMVTDLLEYARTKNDETYFTDVDAELEIQHVLENLWTTIAERNATVTHDVLPRFTGNPVQFMRLLQNLIGNGLKYQAADCAPHVHVAVEDSGEHWHFSVQDNGIGISQDFISQVFEPFKRLHTWQEYTGSGIGLAVCKEIVEKHGGNIWATSTPGEGSIFHFTVRKHHQGEALLSQDR